MTYWAQIGNSGHLSSSKDGLEKLLLSEKEKQAGQAKDLYVIAKAEEFNRETILYEGTLDGFRHF